MEGEGGKDAIAVPSVTARPIAGLVPLDVECGRRIDLEASLVLTKRLKR